MENGNRYFGCRYCGHLQKNLTTADMRCPVCQHMMEVVYLTEKPSRKDRPHVIRTPRYKSGFAHSIVTQLAPLLLLLIALFLTMPVMGKAYAECVTSNYDSTTGQLFAVITAYNKTTKVLHNVQIEVSVNDSATGTLLATQSVEVGTLWWGAKEIYTISIPISSMPSGGVHIQCSLSGNYRNLLPGGTISQNSAARSSQNKQPSIFDFFGKK